MNVPLLSRCLQLVSLLYSQAGYSAAELARQLGVSVRTIYRYFDVLRDIGIPVQFDQQKSGYVIVAQFRLKVSQLSEDELTLLVWAAHTSPVARSGKLEKAVTQAISKLLSQVPPKLRTEATNLLRYCEVAANLELPSADDQERCLQILAAIRQQRQIRLTYQANDDDAPLQTKVAPYRLVLSADGGRLVGRSSWHRNVHSFLLRQIVGIEFTEDSYSPPPPHVTTRLAPHIRFEGQQDTLPGGRSDTTVPMDEPDRDQQ